MVGFFWSVLTSLIAAVAPAQLAAWNERTSRESWTPTLALASIVLVAAMVFTAPIAIPAVVAIVLGVTSAARRIIGDVLRLAAPILRVLS